MVGRVGIEPTETEANGVTDRPNSPTLAPAHISNFKSVNSASVDYWNFWSSN